MTETRVVAPSLDSLVAHSVKALFRRFHLNRDWIIGLIGDRGSGKSLSGANIAIRDFMMSGEPCWSNMQLKMAVKVDDYRASHYGLNGGVVTYESGYIDKQTFLYLDSRYEGGCLFFDEFNIEYGEARRSTSNVNLATDRSVQQLRKLQSGMIYTVLNEAYVDVRIRENTDIFIRCADIAFNPLNLSSRMRQGVVFEWLIYPMTPKLVGNGLTYRETGKPIGPVQVVMDDLWGVIDTYERQLVEPTRYSKIEKLMPVQMVEDPFVVQEKDKYGWLDEKLKTFWDNHAEDGEIIEISSQDLKHEVGCDGLQDWQWGQVINELIDRIPNVESRGGGGRRRPKKYLIPNLSIR